VCERLILVPTPQQLQTKRLALEPLRVEHAAEMVAVLADPALYEYIGGEPPSEADLIARYTRQTSRGDWLNWVLREKSTHDAVGTAQATLREHAAELAWVVSTPAQGKGYATEATSAVIAWLGQNGVHLFEAHVNPDHAASRAVAARLGFQPTQSIKKGEVRWELSTRCHN
jgi:RimJ/RimL family protein N-acetyltransferase